MPKCWSVTGTWRGDLFWHSEWNTLPGACHPPALGHLIEEGNMIFWCKQIWIGYYFWNTLPTSLLDAPALECNRRLARCFILTLRMKHLAWCLAHSSAGAPNIGTNKPFVTERNTHLEYKRNAWLFFLLGVAALEWLRHLAGMVVYSDCQVPELLQPPHT